MSYTTIVIEHTDDNKCPPIGRGTEVLGGEVRALAFDNSLASLDYLESLIRAISDYHSGYDLEEGDFERFALQNLFDEDRDLDLHDLLNRLMEHA